MITIDKNLYIEDTNDEDILSANYESVYNKIRSLSSPNTELSLYVVLVALQPYWIKENT